MIQLPGIPLLWKIGAISASTIALTLAGALILEKQATHRAEQERDSLRSQIENPETGYIARLRTCRDNTARLQQDVERQNLRFERLSHDGERRLSEAEQELTRLRNRATAPAAIEQMTPTATADSVCGRFEEYDARFMGVLRQ